MARSLNRARRARGIASSWHRTSNIGVPVDGATTGDLEGRVAVLIEIFPSRELTAAALPARSVWATSAVNSSINAMAPAVCEMDVML
jgi:hypothetical protein